MTDLYKYMKAEYAAALVAEGTVQVNTLRNLQQDEEYGNEIGDAEEGTLASEMGGHTIDPNDLATQTPQIRRVLRSGNLVFEDSQTILGSFDEITDDCFVYSASTRLDKSAMRSMGYDSCVRIRDRVKFAAALTECLRADGHEVADPDMRLVTYAMRHQDHRMQTGARPVFVKDPRYAYQAEFRMRWATQSTDPKPVRVRCSALRRLVSWTIH